MANEKTSLETTGGALKNADLIRYSEESAGSFSTKKHTLQSFKTYFNSGVVVVGNEWHTPESVAASADPAYSLGDGTAQTFTSYGKTLGQAQADFPLAPITDVSDLVDMAALNQASLLLENSAKQNSLDCGLYGSRKYVINKPIQVATTTTKESKIFNYRGHGSQITTTNNSNIFESVPSSQAIADTYVVRRLVFKDFFLEGAGGVKGNGQTGIKIGGSTAPLFENIYISDCDVSYDLIFCLLATMINCESTNAMTNGFLIRCGLNPDSSVVWTSATLSNSASNGAMLIQPRAFCKINSDYGIYLLGVSDALIQRLTSEGAEDATQSNQPKAAINYDDLNSTVTHGYTVLQAHIEQSYTDAVFKSKARSAIIQLDDIENTLQGSYATENRKIYSADTYAGTTQINLNRLKAATTFQQFDCLSIGSIRVAFEDCDLNGAPQTTADLTANAAMWSSTNPTFKRIVPLLA